MPTEPFLRWGDYSNPFLGGSRQIGAPLKIPVNVAAVEAVHLLL